MDRGFVFSLIRCYIRTLAEDKALYPVMNLSVLNYALDYNHTILYLE